LRDKIQMMEEQVLESEKKYNDITVRDLSKELQA
jgi:hypothetical protein